MDKEDDFEFKFIELVNTGGRALTQLNEMNSLFMFGGLQEGETEPSHFWQSESDSWKTDSECWTTDPVDANLYERDEAMRMLGVREGEKDLLAAMLAEKWNGSNKRVAITKVVLIEVERTVVGDAMYYRNVSIRGTT